MGDVDRIQGRAFLVGCPRSGTTLLQSLLAAHPQIKSFPESHFFETVSRRLSPLGLASLQSRERKRLIRFLQEIDRPDLIGLIPKRSIFLKHYVRAFVKILDAVTLADGKAVWLEKTPGHLRHTGLIERHIPDARFIHILRNGQDVVASLHQVRSEHPRVWTGPPTIESCLARWNGDVLLSGEQLHKPHHKLVRYERLVEDPQHILTNLSGFLGVEFRKEMLDRRGSTAAKLVLASESWKDGALTSGIHSGKPSKFDQLFNEEEKMYILSHLVHTEYLDRFGT